jgi:hypothetical protein
MGIMFGTWKIRSLYRACPLLSYMRNCSKSDLEGVQEVRWDRGCSEPAGEYKCFYGTGMQNHELETGSFVYKRIISVVKRVEFLSDRMSYIIPRGR